MLSGHVITDSYSKNKLQLFKTRTIELEFQLDGKTWENISNEAKELTTGLLTSDPEERLKISDLLTNKWVS